MPVTQTVDSDCTAERYSVPRCGPARERGARIEPDVDPSRRAAATSSRSPPLRCKGEVVPAEAQSVVDERADGAVPATRMTRKQAKAIFAGTLGNAVEYLDWGIYASRAPVFASQFFPKGDSTTAFLSTLAIFAAGFFMRPLGGLVLGAYADRYGR